MSAAGYAPPDAMAWTGGNYYVDPVPGLLARRGGVYLRLGVLLLLALLAAAAWLVLADPPEFACLLLLACCACAVAALRIYAATAEFRPLQFSIVDLAVQVFFSSIKWTLLGLAAWSVYEWFAEGEDLLDAARLFLVRLFRLPLLLREGQPNPVQFALFLPWFPHFIAGWKQFQHARAVNRQLQPRNESQLRALLDRAEARLLEGKPDKATPLLDQADRLLRQMIQGTDHRVILEHQRLLAQEIRELREGMPTSPRAARAPRQGPAAATPTGETAEAAAKQNNQPDTGYESYREYVESLRERSELDWKDVAGLDETVEEIKTAFALALAEAPRGIEVEAPTRFLLYGPPGTGKTLLTAVVSNRFDVPFYNIKVGDVLSKFFGESTRLLSALFEIAGQQGQAVLFFDEIEALCGNRDAGGMQGEERRMVSALLAELDGMRAKGRRSGLFTIAATNVPWQLDPAILSRFEKQFFVPLPDDAGRRRILELQLQARGYEVKAPIEKLVQHTRGYSGRELSRLCQEAIRAMMAEANPQMGELAGRGAQALKKYKLKVQPIAVPHLNAAFKRVRPQTDAQLLERYRQWGERH